MTDAPRPDVKTTVETPSPFTFEVPPPQATDAPGADMNDPYTRELAKMTALDDRVNIGFKMAPSVESEYRNLIASHEQQPQSQSDRDLAIAGRMRMLEHFNAAGDSPKVLQMATETARLYPEVFSQHRFDVIASNNFLTANPEFFELLKNATDEQKAVYQRAARKSDRDVEWLNATRGMMNHYDELMSNPETHDAGLREYWKLVNGSEHQKPQDRGDREVAGKARLRILDHMDKDGVDKAETMQVMIESMTRYPELLAQPRFMSIARNLDAGQNAAWVAAYRNAGGDLSKLQ